MKNYIGTKIIKAELMTDKDFEYIIKGMPTSIKRVPKDGYKVVYEDGYISWSPKDIFEKSYHPLDNITINFLNSDN